MAPPQLNFDMISNILNIRMNEKKNDRFKANFNDCIQNMNNIFEEVDNDCGNMEEAGSQVFIGYTLEIAADEWIPN